MLQRHELEVYGLDGRPKHPVGFEAWQVALLELLFGVTTFHDGHAREEHPEIDRRKNCLICSNTSQDRGVGRLKIDLSL